MSGNVIFVVTIVLLSVFILSILAFIISKVKSNDKKKKQIKEEVSIHTYVKIVADKSSSAAQIQDAIDTVVNFYTFPVKQGIETPPTAKPYLDFILYAVFHKNSSAKMIADMNKELKKANPSYKKEIDAYEEDGLRKRMYRI